MATHRSRTWISLVIIAVATILVIKFGPQKDEEPAAPIIATTTPPTLEQKMVMTTKTIREENKAGGYTLEVKYPQVSGLTRSDAEIKINKTIGGKINDVISDFKKSNNDVRDPLPGAGPSTLDITYSAQSNMTIPNLLSVRLIESFFESGAAHPGHYIETLNFNTSTGAEITLDDVFSSSDYLQRLSTYTRAEMQKKIGSNEDLYPQITSGTTPNEENFASFLFSDTGLIIVFQEYQVASYAAGVQEVLVPYSEIKDIIDQNGPLAFLFN